MIWYRKKPEVVRAFQMTAERIKDTADWPDWLLVEYAQDRFIPDGVDDGPMFFDGHPVSTGDWMTLYSDGEVHHYTAAYFAAMFEPMDIS